MDARPDTLDRIRGCLLGGAVGDALGAPVEFSSLAEIRARCGPDGIADYAPAYGGRGTITDDTQMTLFTAEGLLRAANRSSARGLCSVEGCVWHAYQRWYLTQGGRLAQNVLGGEPDGWLFAEPRLHARRAPGNSCLSALASGRFAQLRDDARRNDEPVNDSKGCGAVMRAAPAGLIKAHDPFRLGCGLGALTHGHPSGYLPAGVLARLVAGLLDGVPLYAAYRDARVELLDWERHEETLEALDRATDLVERAGGRLAPEDLETLGGGWTGEEALAIALACCLSAEDFEDAVRRAVNHSGDSDSTGSLAGQIWGAAYGAAGIPERWLEPLELRDVVETLAEDLDAVFHGGGAKDPEDGTYEAERYPGW